MNKIKFIISAIIACFIVFNVLFFTKSTDKNYSIKGIMVAFADGNESGSENGNGVRDCLTASKLRVTSIKGCVNVSVKVGDLLDSSAGLEACVEFEWKDVYKIDCYKGKGTCTEYDWMVCSSAGCPKFCS
jgi:hypothetical protein